MTTALSALKTSIHLPAGIDENRAVDHAAWTSMAASVRLPTGELDENRAIDCVARLIPMLRHKMAKEYSREWLQTELQKGLREGLLPLTTHAVYAAEAGQNEICDAALRIVFAEMVGGVLPQRAPGHLQIWAYGQRAVLRDPHKRPQGRNWHDHFVGDIQTCNLISFVSREFGVQPTRSQDKRPNAKRAPSAISIVVAALARNGIHLNEASVQRSLWHGLPGEVVRGIAPTLHPAGNYTHEAAAQPQNNRQPGHLRRALLNGVSHASLTLPRPEIVHITPDLKS
jgi:hypothetical protein